MSSSSSNSPTTFDDIHPDIIGTHILPRLDGPSLSAAAAGSSYLRYLCTQHNLWSQICKSAWPSLAHPRLDAVISAFPEGHRAFFRDSFPALIAQDSHRDRRRSWSTWQPDYPPSDRDRANHHWATELISAVDIHYQNDVVYSRVKFTDTTNGFLSPALWIELNDDPDKTWSGAESEPRICRVIDLKVDELLGSDDPAITHLKESVTLNWILIDPTRKRSVNLSSIKPVLARKHWMNHEIQLRYVVVLPGCDPNADEMVQCSIEVTCAVGKGGVGLHVREVVLQILDLEGRCLSGREFLVITQGAILEEKNVKRQIGGDQERERRYKEFLEMRKEKRQWIKMREKRMKMASKVATFGIVVFFFIWVYHGILCFKIF